MNIATNVVKRPYDAAFHNEEGKLLHATIHAETLTSATIAAEGVAEDYGLRLVSVVEVNEWDAQT